MNLTIRLIQEMVARHYGLSLSDILSGRVDTASVRARHVAIYIARRLTAKSLPQIGTAFNRDHASVLYAVRRVADLIEKDEELNLVVANLSRRLLDQQRHALNDALIGWAA